MWPVICFLDLWVSSTADSQYGNAVARGAVIDYFDATSGQILYIFVASGIISFHWWMHFFLRSPPVADDAEVEGATFLDVGCRVEPELNHAQLSRPLPISAPTTPSKHMNGHVEGSPTKLGLVTPPKRTVCTRSQALKELQLQSSPTAINSLKAPSSPTSNGLAIPCALHSPVPSPASDSPVAVSAPSTPTSSNCSAVEDGCTSHTGPPTPHKIQALNEERLRLDSPLSPSSALSKLKLSLAPKKLEINGKTTKARRK